MRIERESGFGRRGIGIGVLWPLFSSSEGCWKRVVNVGGIPAAAAVASPAPAFAFAAGSIPFLQTTHSLPHEHYRGKGNFIQAVLVLGQKLFFGFGSLRE